MKYLKKKIRKHRYLVLILIVYFLFHLANLTLIPISNDEAIYLSWGWFNTRYPRSLFNSLHDAKQPLIIWIFGIFQGLFSDQLFAGRLVSVIIGSVSLIGIYKIAKTLFNTTTAVIASFIYLATPYFVFYNRLALMEASIICVGIWSFYTLINFIQKPDTGNAVWLGVVLGIGLFIKTSSFLFIASTLLVVVYLYLKDKRKDLIKPYLNSLVVLVLVDSLLFINPLFWKTLSSNNRYTFGPLDILSFPFTTWVKNIAGFFEISFIYITPLVFVSAIAGLYLMRKRGNNSKLFIIYFLLALSLEIILVRGQNKRYLVSFVPFFVIPASYFLHRLLKGNFLKKFLFALSVIIPVYLSSLLIFKPEYYINQIAKITKYSDLGYIRGQTSGKRIKEVMQYIKDNSYKRQPTLIFVALNIGNPESAVNVYSHKSPNFVSLHMDSSFFPNIKKYECMSSEYPAFFVTRDNQLSGMNKYFSLEKSFPHQDINYSVNIYSLIEGCSGDTLSLSDFYHKSIETSLNMKR